MGVPWSSGLDLSCWLFAGWSLRMAPKSSKETRHSSEQEGRTKKHFRVVRLVIKRVKLVPSNLTAPNKVSAPGALITRECVPIIVARISTYLELGVLS